MRWRSPVRVWRERSWGERFGWLGVTLAAVVGGVCAFVVGSLEALIPPNVEYGMAVFFLGGFVFLLGGFVVVVAVLAPWWPRVMGPIMVILALPSMALAPLVLAVLVPIGFSFAAADPARSGDRWPQVGLVGGLGVGGGRVGTEWGGSEGGWFAGVLEGWGSR